MRKTAEDEKKKPAAAAPANESSPAPIDDRSGFPIAYALRRALRKGYGPRDFRADVLAGVVVGIVALPLSMALAIAVGAPPQHGLYTAIFAGFSVSLLGGCKFQVTGPTAAFVVILAPIVTQHGLRGLLTAGLMAGVLLVAMGAFRLGSLIRFIPYPVTTGFTTGIATVIATLQIKDVFGLSMRAMPDHYVDKITALWQARASAAPAEVAVAAATLALLLGVPRITKRVPAPLIAIVLVSAAATLVHRIVPSVSVATIGSRFHTTVHGVEVAGIPPIVPTPALPWGSFSFGFLRDLFPAAFAIAMLGAIESLLSAVIADGLTGTKHEPNSELVALGVGNIVAPLFGGIAATGALARTATNIRAGARSPIACATHSVVVLLAILVFAPMVAYVPMASLAALLLLVAWNMSELRHFVGMVRIAPRSDVLVLFTCFLLTVFFDMVVAVGVGFVLAAILFMRRMAEITETKLSLDNTEEHRLIDLPPGVSFYEINGPLFFGAAQNAMEALHASHRDAFHALILNLGKVPIIDATGFAALENAVDGLVKRKKVVIFAGPLPKPRTIFDKAAFDRRHPGMVFIAEDLLAALKVARETIAQSSPFSTRSTPVPRTAERPSV
jgi:SulP family sulfate permease